MKSAIIIAGLVIVGSYVLLKPAPEIPSGETLVPMPRAKLWARLSEPFASIEQKAQNVTTVTGTPPVPVKFTFDKQEGKMLDMKGQAGFRSIEVKAWLEDGARPGETRLKVLFDPESLGTKTGDTDQVYQLQTVLDQTNAQFIEGQRIKVLFGAGLPAH